MQQVQLGELLVRHGVLTSAQRDAVVQAQRQRGGPLGVIAEEMFGVSPAAVERAWAEQFAGLHPPIDPRTHPIQARALEVITRRQAWQFRMLPMQLADGGQGLVACTTQEHLARALRFAGWRLGHNVQFLLASPRALGEALCEHYPMDGMTPESVMEGAGGVSV